MSTLPACWGGDLGAAHDGDLDGERSDATRRAVDQHTVSGQDVGECVRSPSERGEAGDGRGGGVLGTDTSVGFGRTWSALTVA